MAYRVYLRNREELYPKLRIETVRAKGGKELRQSELRQEVRLELDVEKQGDVVTAVATFDLDELITVLDSFRRIGK